MSLKMKFVRFMVKRMGNGFFNGDEIDVQRIREALKKAYASHSVEKGVREEPATLGGVAIAYYTPERRTSEHIIYYVHGGGLVTGDRFTAGAYSSELALATGCRVVACSYRLAPEDPFPAGLDDSFTVYKELLKANPGSKIALIGDSGGAYLSLVMALRARDEGLQSPTCVVLNSVLADMSGMLERRDTKEEVTLSVRSLGPLARMYAPEGDWTNPYISPIRADFAGLPPLRVVYDRGELLAVDSKAVVKKAMDAGVRVEVAEYHGTFHAFTTTGKNTPESKKELEAAAKFMVESFERHVRASGRLC